MEQYVNEVILEELTSSHMKLKVLILEDLSSDVELIKFQFEELDLEPVFKVTGTREKYLHLLNTFNPDLIISDFQLPTFDGLRALNILRKELNDNITPFIFVTGSLGEENAVKSIKEGATDFIIKERVYQLPAAVLRALREKEEKLIRSEANYRERISERRFKMLVQEGSDLIIITDYNGRIQFASDNYKKILGYSAQEMMGADPFKLIHPDDIYKVRSTFNRIKNTNSIKVEPYRFQDARKNWRWLQSTLTNLYSDEAIAGIVINSSDVTELIEQEIDLKLSNERYRLACLATQDLIYDWDLTNGTISRDGQALYRMFGYSPKWAQNETFWKERIHPEDKELVYSHLKECLQDSTQSVYQQSYRFRRKDGTYAFLHEKCYIVREANGVAIRLIGATRDISEQKEKERTRDLIVDLSTMLSKPKSLSACMKDVLQALVRCIGVDYAELWLPAKLNNHMNLVSQYAESFHVEMIEEDIGKIPKNKGLAGKVFKEGKAAFWADIKNQPKFIKKLFAERAHLESALGIPISKADHTIGVFLFYSREKQFNFKSEITILHEVSKWLSPELQRKQAKEELDRFFSDTVDLLCVLGVDGYLKKINPAFTNILGYTELEFLGKPLKYFIYPDDHLLTKSQLGRLQQGEKSVSFEVRIISKSGLIKWFSWSATIQPNDEVVFAVGKDITEKKRLEEFIQETQTMAKIGGWEVDLINQTSYWTSQSYDILELDHKHQPNLTTSINFFKGENRTTIERCINEGIQFGKSWDVQVRVTTAKGNVKWVRSMGKAELIDGKCIRLYGVFQDIEDQKKREEDLNVSNKRYELASKATHEAIYEWSFQNNSILWSDNYQVLFGYKKLKESFDEWREKVHHLDQERIIDSLDALLKNPDQHFWKNEYRLIRKDKRVAFVEERGYIIRDEKGNPLSMIGSVNDQTEKKRFQEQLLENTIQSQEKERNRIAQELHDGIVQEMVVSSMQCDLLHHLTKSNPELNTKIQEISDNIRKLTDNTRNISHDLLSADVIKMTFNELLERLDLNLRIMSKIEFNIENFLDSKFIRDEDLKINLYRVIQELTNNIIKHSGASKALILIERIQKVISLKVIDNGRGISEKDSSTGIGLANVSNRINMIGGTIKLQNVKNGGLEVKVTVPIG
tara:strand:+ start:1216 stop:4647 length:3432 start_codon:yes stop_codon:yes gene_type:complete